jgi:hypothetical protein
MQRWRRCSRSSTEIELKIKQDVRSRAEFRMAQATIAVGFISGDIGVLA